MNNKISHDFPAPGEPLAPSHASADTLALLTRRRSTPAIGLAEPGPDANQIEHLLGIASRVPDHGKLAPWRFILFEGEARNSFGMILGKVWAVKNPDATPDQIRCEQQRFERAPLLIGASAMGFGAQWLTEWYAYDCDIKDALGLRSGERIAGYIYIGSSASEVMERPRPRAHVGRWKA